MTHKPPFTFKGNGLIPTGLFWFIQEWEQKTFYPSKAIVSGGVFDQVNDFTKENVLSMDRTRVYSKTLMAYKLDQKKSEKEILKSALNLGITRYREDLSGTQIFFDHPNFYNMSFGREKEVDLFDVHQIVLRHKLQDGTFSKKLPINKNIHIFIEKVVTATNKYEKALKIHHLLLRVNSLGEVILTANEYLQKHEWQIGDFCIFVAHKNFVPYLNTEAK
ncbi:MAG: hypothetical protein M3P22_00610 [bacterium]|nr:hypothetical protein [bacterium]